MQAPEFLEATRKYLERFKEENYTGSIIFTLNFSQGGIGKVGVEIKHDFGSWLQKEEKNKKELHNDPN